LTITIGHIKEMTKKGYFTVREARALGEETTSELNEDEVVVLEDFFVAGLRMPLYSMLVDILLRF
jgi:hypothetical protein